MIKCKLCEATCREDNASLARAKWGWMFAPDPGWGDGVTTPSSFYACPDHSDPDKKDAFAHYLCVICNRGGPPQVKSARFSLADLDIEGVYAHDQCVRNKRNNRARAAESKTMPRKNPETYAGKPFEPMRKKKRGGT